MLTVQISMGRLSLLSKPVLLYIFGGGVEMSRSTAVTNTKSTLWTSHVTSLQVLTIFMSIRGHKSIKCLKYKSAFLSFVLHICQSTWATQTLGSDTSLARHAQPYEIRTQVGQLCFSLQARVMFVILLCPFLKNAIWGLQDTLNFIISLLRTAELVDLGVWRQPASWLEPREVTSQKLKPMVTLRVESCFILKLLKKAVRLWRGTGKSALGLSLCPFTK